MLCENCNNSCGDDFKTKTKYKPEDTPGDAIKVILLQVYDLVFKWNLSKSETKLILANLVDEHIEETDDLEPKTSK